MRGNQGYMRCNLDYLKTPENKEDWSQISQQFEEEWNFPHCLGAVDGKHVAIECPHNAGSTYLNYKSFHSVVLMAVCDAKYRFTYVDIGSYGRDNDAANFAQSYLSKAFESGDLPIHMLPYVIVGDEIFPFKLWLMKPYPGKSLNESQAIYNYRLSRCRRTIENAFGILVARWRIFRRPIRASVDTVDRIVQATVCLHNNLQLTDNARYVPFGFVDSEDSSGHLISGKWRSTEEGSNSALQPLRRVGSNMYTHTAKSVRENFLVYCNSSEGSLPWQLSLVRNCGRSS